MAYNQILADKIREALTHIADVEEKEMMGGLTFMVNGKMCIGIIKDEMMCRIHPEMQDELIEKRGCRTMDFTKRPMRGFVMVDESGMQSPKDFSSWVKLCLDFNIVAKSSKKKRSKQ